jgi:hypothetical protein
MSEPRDQTSLLRFDARELPTIQKRQESIHHLREIYSVTLIDPSTLRVGPGLRFLPSGLNPLAERDMGSCRSAQFSNWAAAAVGLSDRAYLSPKTGTPPFPVAFELMSFGCGGRI